MDKVNVVIYEGKQYEIVWDYGNDYIEIKEKGGTNSSIKLVSKDQIKLISKLSVNKEV